MKVGNRIYEAYKNEMELLKRNLDECTYAPDRAALEAKLENAKRVFAYMEKMKNKED